MAGPDRVAASLAISLVPLVLTGREQDSDWPERIDKFAHLRSAPHPEPFEALADKLNAEDLRAVTNAIIQAIENDRELTADKLEDYSVYLFKPISLSLTDIELRNKFATVLADAVAIQCKSPTTPGVEWEEFDRLYSFTKSFRMIAHHLDRAVAAEIASMLGQLIMMECNRITDVIALNPAHLSTASLLERPYQFIREQCTEEVAGTIASAIADALLKEMTHVTSQPSFLPDVPNWVASCFETIAPALTTEKANATASALSKMLTETMRTPGFFDRAADDDEDSLSYKQRALSKALGKFAVWLDGEEFDALLKSLQGTPSHFRLEVLAAASAYAKGDNAQLFADAVIESVVNSGKPEEFDLWRLGIAIQAVADKLNREDALAVANQIVRASTDKNKFNSFQSSEYRELGHAFHVIAPRLTAEEANQRASRLASTFVHAASQSYDDRFISSVAEGYMFLASNLNKVDASRFAAALLAEGTRNVKRPEYHQTHLNTALQEVAGLLTERDISSLSKSLVESTVIADDKHDIWRIAQVFQAVGYKLDDRETHEMAHALANRIVSEFSKAAEDIEANHNANLEAIHTFTEAFHGVADKLGNEEARCQSQTMTNRILSLTKPLTYAGQDGVFGHLKSCAYALSFVAHSLAAQDLIRIAKSPSCVGPVEKAVLLRLGEKMRPAQQFESTWDMVEWLRHNEPDLYVESQQPAMRP